MGLVEALYIFDETNTLILSHIWNGRPPPPAILLPLYLAHPSPRPSLLYETSTNPPTLVHSIRQDNLLLIAPTSEDVEPLEVLELLHRVVDAFEDFLGSPLLPAKIAAGYDVVAQLLGEICDCGIVNATEPNALRDLVDAPSWVNKLLGGVGLPSSSPSLAAASGGSLSSLSSRMSMGGMGSTTTAQPAIPWRRANVRHTSNEMYVDIVETLHVITAPSGLPLAARAHGSIVFTAKVSGTPDLFLSLTSSAGGPSALAASLALPVFHPCVRLARWRDRPGDLSFVPPDGKFLLMGYEVDLLGADYIESLAGDPAQQNSKKNKTKPRAPKSPLQIPATVSVRTKLGDTHADFEVRLHLNPRFATGSNISGGNGGASSTILQNSGSGGTSSSAATTSLESAFSKATTSLSAAASSRSAGTSTSPTLDAVTVRVPIPSGMRSLGSMKSTRGEARWSVGDATLEWHFTSKDLAGMVAARKSSEADVLATLRCSVTGKVEDDDDDYDDDGGEDADEKIPTQNRWDYTDDVATTSSKATAHEARTSPQTQSQPQQEDTRAQRRQRANEALMPGSASVSFSVKGWLASGVRVDKLVIDAQRSRGMGQGVQPYKGVKYVTVSEGGVETRC